MNSVSTIAHRLLNMFRSRKKGDYLADVIIDICTACGARCLYCLHQHRSLVKRQLMDNRVFLKITDILARENFQHVHLYMSGEPFLHPDLPDFVTVLAERRIDTSIGTKLHVPIDFVRFNAALSQADLMGQKVELLMTIDTLRPDTQRKIAPGIDTMRVLSNLAEVSKLRDRHKSLAPVCTTVVNRHNEEQLEEIRLGLADLGFTVWSPKQMGYYMGYIATGEDLATIAGFVATNAIYRARFEVKDGELVSFKKRCDLGSPVPAISPEGNITVCCHDMFHVLKLGNVLREGSIRRIVASEPFRKAVAFGQRMNLEICKGCN